MALTALIGADEFGELNDALKEHYVQDGDSYRLDTDIEVENVDGLKSALASEREARKKAEREARETVVKYKDIDPEKYKQALTTLGELETQSLEAAKEWETLKGKRQEEITAAGDAVRNELAPKLSKTQQQLEKVLIDNELINEFNAQGGFAKAAKNFAALTRDQIAYTLPDDESGDVELSFKDGKSTSIKDFVAALKETDEFGVFFESDISGGSGASQQPRGRKPATGKKRSEMSDTEKALFIRTNGLDKYNELPA